jgi:hypothetical protein
MSLERKGIQLTCRDKTEMAEKTSKARDLIQLLIVIGGEHYGWRT